MKIREPSMLDSTQAPPLDKRYELIDILFGIMMPGLVSSLWPNLNPKERIATLIVSLGFAACSVWWGATICHSFSINKTMTRLLVHCYTFSAFVSFVGALPLFGYAFSVTDRRGGSEWRNWVSFGGSLLGVGLVISMFWVERARARLLRATQLEKRWRENARQP